MSTQVDLTKVKPYGDTLNDGRMQFSFTLPIPAGDEADEAARQLLTKMGIEEAAVVYSEDLGVGYTYFTAYGKCQHTVDYSSIEVPKVDVDIMDKYGVEDFIKENIKRDVVIVGACSGTDAHTVGIDAIMNMKGFDGHYGLERYKGVEAINLGSQVPNEELIAKAIELNADAILASTIISHDDIHYKNMKRIHELCIEKGIRDKIILTAGGTQVTPELACENGMDQGFGRGTNGAQVATFLVEKRDEINEK